MVAQNTHRPKKSMIRTNESNDAVADPGFTEGGFRTAYVFLFSKG